MMNKKEPFEVFVVKVIEMEENKHEIPQIINLENDNNTLPNQKNSKSVIIYSVKTTLSRGSRSLKRKVVYTDNMIALKNEYYSILTTKKLFNKQLVQQIHNTILVPSCGFLKKKRDEYRCIPFYFQNYANKKDKILECLRQNKDLILKTILKDMPKKAE